jgi:ribosomal-protein-serine acetyltransferase
VPTFDLGPRSSLRPVEPGLAAELFALIESNRERLRTWLLWVDQTTTVDDVGEFLEKSVRELADGVTLNLGIWSEERLAGVIGAKFRPVDCFAEIGYWIAAEFEGRGLITRAVEAMLPYLFEERDLNRVEIRCAPGNVRSCRVPERLGFQMEGVLRETARLPGRFVDNRVYGLLRSEWRTRTGA